MTGHVYFLRCGDFVKIGYSATPDVRVRDLSNATPYQVELIGLHPGSKRHEFALHKYFSNLRHSDKREWFILTDGIRDVAANGFPPDLHVTALCLTPESMASARHVLRARTSLGLSQSQLAREMGVDQTTVSLWESGRSIPRGPAKKLLCQLVTESGPIPREREAAE